MDSCLTIIFRQFPGSNSSSIQQLIANEQPLSTNYIGNMTEQIDIDDVVFNDGTTSKKRKSPSNATLQSIGRYMWKGPPPATPEKNVPDLMVLMTDGDTFVVFHFWRLDVFTVAKWREMATPTTKLTTEIPPFDMTCDSGLLFHQNKLIIF